MINGNRKIKFRQFRGGEMVSIDGRGIGFEYVTEAEQYDHYVMQYTGICDNNGFEIWEGDLIKADYPDNERKSNYVIKWKDAGFYLHHDYDNCNFWQPLDKKRITDNKLLVVGNIYEHPYLIEKHLNIKQ